MKKYDYEKNMRENYGVVDTSILKQKEDAFHSLVDDIAKAHLQLLSERLEYIEREQKANNILKIIADRK